MLFENERCNFPCVLCQGEKKKEKIKIKDGQRYSRKGSSLPFAVLGARTRSGLGEEPAWSRLLLFVSGFH